MFNPSGHGWIDKFFSERREGVAFQDAQAFYLSIRRTGFLYGHIVAIDSPTPVNLHGWLTDEISKAALLNALYQSYRLELPDGTAADFTTRAVAFYNAMNPQGFAFFRKMLPGQLPSHQLEKIIDERVHTNDNIISKNFSHILTNALLFVDVLAFRRFLQMGSIPDKYLKKIEETIISIVTLALRTKSDKSPHDALLIKLFEASVRYSKFSKVNVDNLEALELSYFTDPLERRYLIDMAGLALWSDGKVERDEAYFLHSLAQTMDVPDAFVTQSIADTDAFISHHKKHIPYFNYSNPVKHFYDQTTQLVVTLINRNRKRLAKEISESGELMKLLAQSTQRDLDKAEKKKVKRQLLDICKSIPSLTIFLIPGGSLLLPILIKFIPQLLPSTFNENLEDE